MFLNCFFVLFFHDLSVFCKLLGVPGGWHFWPFFGIVVFGSLKVGPSILIDSTLSQTDFQGSGLPGGLQKRENSIWKADCFSVKKRSAVSFVIFW